MDERVLRFRVGVVVVAAAIITVILITLLGAWPSPFKPRYTLHILFPSAPGVTVDTPVRKSGIQIGRVSQLELREAGGVVVTLKIDEKYPLRRNEIARIRTGSFITGDAILEFAQSDDPTLGTDLIRDEYLTSGVVETSPFEVLAQMEGDIKSTLDAIRGAGLEVTTLAQRWNAFMGDNNEQLIRIVGKTELALESVNRVMISVDDILGDPALKDQLRDSLERVPQLFNQAQETLAAVQNTLTQFNGVALRAERNLANLEEFTAPLGERGEEISQNLVDSIRNVNELLANFAELSQALRNREGTVGQLITNPELYNRLNRTVGEIEKLVRRLEPIVNDVRVITDKVARDPSQMGVKGILDRRPPGVGQKFPTH
jgi:phospholipid/cholesterol/gamma-HCH transport system substrate-binding protein